MITKEILKREIDNVQDEYLIPLYKIIKTFEHSNELDDFEHNTQDVAPIVEKFAGNKQEEWHKFLIKYAGCLADSPIERGDQGDLEQY